MSSASSTTSRSAEIYRRAVGLLPGGVNSPVRAMRSIGRDPIFIAAGRGSRITDRATLYSSTEFKKIRLLYFTEDFRAWEREHAGV